MSVHLYLAHLLGALPSGTSSECLGAFSREDAGRGQGSNSNPSFCWQIYLMILMTTMIIVCITLPYFAAVAGTLVSPHMPT
jgi:hypothetical protein